MAVPFIDLQRFEPGLLDEWRRRVDDLTRNTRFVGGPDVRRLEERLAAEAGVARAVGCANGTDALQLALRAVGVGPGDRVLLPDATFWATFEAVVNVGARPVTVDVDPEDLQLDFELFRRAVDELRPSAVLLVHLYGWASARLDDFRTLCRERDLPLVEDGAQAWGVRWRDRPIFEGSTIATVSFYPAKVLGSCGDAGAVLCADEELADRVVSLGNHGRASHYDHERVGWNSRLGGLEACWLDLALDHLPERLRSRREAAATYRDRLGAFGVRCVAPPEGFRENGYLNVTLWDPGIRPRVEAALRERSIGFGVVYPGAMSDQPGARPWLDARIGGPTARRLSASVLNLPLFAGITDSEVEEVLAAMGEIVAEIDPEQDRDAPLGEG